MIKYDNYTIKVSCSANQCKRKQWCKRYQLYLHIGSNKARLWEGVIDLDNLEQIKLHQPIDDTCEYFIPTEQYQVKEKLDKLINKLNSL